MSNIGQPRDRGLTAEKSLHVNQCGTPARSTSTAPNPRTLFHTFWEKTSNNDRSLMALGIYAKCSTATAHCHVLLSHAGFPAGVPVRRDYTFNSYGPALAPRAVAPIRPTSTSGIRSFTHRRWALDYLSYHMVFRYCIPCQFQAADVLQVFCFIAVGTLLGFTATGRPRNSQLKRGTEIRDRLPVTVIAIRARRPNAITLAGVPLKPMDETKHFKLIGTTGTGKSTAIREILQSALDRGDRAIIADPDGGYLDRFL